MHHYNKYGYDSYYDKKSDNIIHQHLYHSKTYYTTPSFLLHILAKYSQDETQQSRQWQYHLEIPMLHILYSSICLSLLTSST